MNDQPDTISHTRLTHLVKCAGCASKIGPAQLVRALTELNLTQDDRMLVGFATGDDAGVIKMSDDLAIIQTVDFFTPIVDDPYLYGQIAAANSLSDVYAMGGIPLTAMNILCYPISTREPNELGLILKGGADKITEAGAMLVGGHSVDVSEPKYGLSVTGTAHPDHIATNAGARPGDIVVLTKPLGTGIITTAQKFDECPPEEFNSAVASMAKLNAGAADAMREIGIDANGIHAATDITGFSLMGHLFHLAKASGVAININSKDLPIFDGVLELVAAGNTTKGGRNNENYLSPNCDIASSVGDNLRGVLFDPQTSGGLAICVAPDRLVELLSLLRDKETIVQAVIGSVALGVPKIVVI